MIRSEGPNPMWPPQVHNGITSTPTIIKYWCGKIDNVLVEDPLILTEDEQRKHDKFVKEHEANPWPVCQRCRKAKDRAVPK